MKNIGQRHGNMEQTDSCRGLEEGGELWKEEEGAGPRTCMNDAWTRTRERGLTVG